MSILGQTPPTTAPIVPGEQPEQSVIFLVILLLIAAIVAWHAGVFRRDSIRGPVRLGRRTSLAPLIIAGGFGLFAWVMSAGLLPGGSDPNKLDANKMATLATVPYSAGILALLAAHKILGGDRLPRRLGYTRAKVLSGLWTAVVAIFILVAWWQEFRRDAWEWKVWLGVTVWYLVMWAFAKSR